MLFSLFFQDSSSHKFKLLIWFGLMFLTLSLDVKIQIRIIKIDLVVITYLHVCMNGSVSSLHTCMNMKFVGALSLQNDAKLYKIEIYLCSVYTTHKNILGINLARNKSN